MGYSRRCTSPHLERGVEKVAIFVNSAGLPKHAARQLESGMWANKCGDYEDIECFRLEAVSKYGDPVKFMKRRLDGKPFLMDRILSILKVLGIRP